MTFDLGSVIRIAAFSSLLAKSSASSWSYTSNHGGGPDSWVGECGKGKSQSPIDIPIANNRMVSSTDSFIFKHYDEIPKVQKISNNGHTIKLSIVENVRPKLQPKLLSGGLPGNFQFEQLHFHWGSSDDHGSEHLIGGKRYPMEVHLVHFNSQFGSRLDEAIEKGNGSYNTLAVLGIMFDIQKKNNSKFAPIVDAMKYVRYVNQEYQKMELFPLVNLLPRNTDMFYRYNGSLTTPSCEEIVVWTVFKDPIFISEYQMNEFRQVLNIVSSSGDKDDHDKDDHDKDDKKSGGGHNPHRRSLRFRRDDDKSHSNKTEDSIMVNNYRPVMPLNNRTILDVDTSIKRFGNTASATVPVSTLAMILTITLSKIF